MIKDVTIKLIAHEDLTLAETRGVFEEIFSEKASPVQISSFLTALAAKGETYQEIVAAAQVVRAKAHTIQVREELMGIESQEPVFDTCGTGGSGVNKFNISTAVAFVVAASGVKVAKHCNRAVSSSCGSW